MTSDYFFCVIMNSGEHVFFPLGWLGNLSFVEDNFFAEYCLNTLWGSWWLKGVFFKLMVVVGFWGGIVLTGCFEELM